MIHAMYGKLAVRHEQECAAHLQTIDLLRRVVAGEIDSARVVVTDNTWTLLPADVPVLKTVRTNRRASDQAVGEEVV